MGAGLMVELLFEGRLARLEADHGWIASEETAAAGHAGEVTEDRHLDQPTALFLTRKDTVERLTDIHGS